MLRAVRTDTTLPLVRNLLRCSPSSPISAKNCLLPVVVSPATHVPFHVGVVPTLLPAQDAREQDARAVHGEQRADGVELGREDLEHDERKRELPDGGADVGALEGALRRPDLDQLGPGQHDGARAVQAQVVSVCGMAALEHVELAENSSGRR
jgi:hypothetical protein